MCAVLYWPGDNRAAVSFSRSTLAVLTRLRSYRSWIARSSSSSWSSNTRSSRSAAASVIWRSRSASPTRRATSRSRRARRSSSAAASSAASTSRAAASRSASAPCFAISAAAASGVAGQRSDDFGVPSLGVFPRLSRRNLEPADAAASVTPPSLTRGEATSERAPGGGGSRGSRPSSWRTSWV